MEKILKIEQKDFKVDGQPWREYEGYIVYTSKQNISLGISNGQACCESWGYFMSEDNLDEFIDSEFLSLKIVDSLLNKKELPDNLYEGDAMFVNIETSKGLLQFVAYNEHNGYYGHDACVISQELNYETCL